MKVTMTRVNNYNHWWPLNVSAPGSSSKFTSSFFIAIALLLLSAGILSAGVISIDDFDSENIKGWSANRDAVLRIVPRSHDGNDKCLSVSGKAKWLKAEFRLRRPVSLVEPVYVVAELRSVGGAGEVQLMVGNGKEYESFRQGPSTYDARKDWIRAIWKVNGFFSGDTSMYFDRLRFCQRVTGDGEHGFDGIAWHQLLVDHVNIYTGEESETIRRECGIRGAQTSYEGPLNFRLSEDAGLTVWHSPSANKVLPQQKPPAKMGHEVSLSLAGNESESFQLCLRSAHDRQDITLLVSNFHPSTGQAIASPTLQWHPVRLVPTASRYYGIPVDQWWPEPLSWDRNFSLNSEETQSLWFTVTAPANCKGGVYTGNLELLEGSKTLACITLKVNVWDFSLPLRPTFRTNQQLWLDAGSDRNAGSQTPVLWEALETLAKHKQFDAQSFNSLPPSVRQKAVGEWGQNSFKLPYCGGHRGGWQRKPTLLAGMGMFTPAYESALAEKLKEMTAYYRIHDLMQYCFIYLWDEPFGDPEVYKMIKWLGTVVKSRYPNLKTLAAAPYNLELSDKVDIFLSGYTYPEATKIGLKRGAEFWWTGVQAFYVDLSGVDQRMRFGFESIQNGLTGAYSWAMTYWKTRNVKTGKIEEMNAWDRPDMWNKNAIVIYPGNHAKSKPNKVCPSISLELTRDGIEDYEYVVMLRKCLHQLKQKGNEHDANEVMGLIQRSEKLYAAPTEVREDFKILDDLYSLRSDIGELLQKHKELVSAPS